MGNLEAQMKKMKEEMNKIKVTGSAGAGMVELTMNGEYQVQSLSINEELVGKEDKAALEVLLISAFNDATQKVKAEVESFARGQVSQFGAF